MDFSEVIHPGYKPADSSDNIAGPDAVITNDYDDDDVMDDPKIGKNTAA